MQTPAARSARVAQSRRAALPATATRAAVARATIYLDKEMHKALRLKAADTHRSISEIVSEAVRESLREDQQDLAMIEARKHEKGISYETLLKRLKANGTL